MKIEDLPEWTKKRSIYIMAGVELVAYRHPDGDWNLKTGQCNMCGECCTNLKKHSFPIINGRCIYLAKEPGDNDQWLCGLGISRPFGCCVGQPTKVPDCTESFGVVKDGNL